MSSGSRAHPGGSGRPMGSARGDFRGERLAVAVAKQVAGELAERALIDVPFEIDHGLERNPEAFHPPAVKSGPPGGPQAQAASRADHPNQDLDSFLSREV